ncbi:MAG: caspase family protein [Micromonosporaceae bacterium]
MTRERRYRALLVGNWHYPDDPANLPDLKGPVNDVSGLAQALADPEVGLFAPADITMLTERASHEIAAEMEAFFADASRTDLLFVYYSGHGLTADDGSLLLCGRNARTDRKLATTVSAETVNRMIRGCAAAAVVIVLDCCHAGAFKSGDLAGELAGRGRFVLTASRARDRAPDADHATGLSRFTGHLLRGLRGGAASAGADTITLSDLYRYVHRQMTSDGPVIPQQRFDGDGEVAIARLAAVLAAPGHPAEPQAPTLFVSEPFIDVGEVWAGDLLPVERVTVTARGAGGAAAAWTASAEADWVRVATDGALLLITVAPREGATRANVTVRNEVTGETRTVRVSARLRPATPPPPEPASSAEPAAAPGAPASGDGDLLQAPFGDRRQPTTAPQIPASLLPRTPPGPPEDLRKRIYAGFDQAWPSGRVASTVEELVIRHQMRASVLWPSGKQRRDIRELGGVPPPESLLGFADPGTGTEWIVFTERAVYWVRKGATVAVPYREFMLRSFRVIAPTPGGPFTHLDLGDGVPRFTGSTTQTVHAVLTALQERFRNG